MFYRFDIQSNDVLPIHVFLTFAVLTFCDEIKFIFEILTTFGDFTQLHRYFHNTRPVLHHTTSQLHGTRQ